MVGLHVLPPAVLAVLAIGNQAGHSERGFAALKGVEQVRIPQLGSALLVQNGQTGIFVVLNGVFDIHAVQDAADEFGLGEVEFFAGICDPQFFFCGHSGIGAILRLPRCVAHNKSA